MWITIHTDSLYQTTNDKSHGEFGHLSTRQGWYVAWMHNDTNYCIPLTFDREADAKRAEQAIANLTDWDGDRNGVLTKIRTIGFKKLRQIMIESLAW